MQKLFYLVLLCPAMYFIACEDAESDDHDDVSTEEIEAALIEVDKAWSEATKTLDGHMNYFAEDAILMASNAPMAKGVDAIRKANAPMFDMPGLSISWTPVQAVAAASGELGYTLGTYTFSVADTSGGTFTDNGKYLTIWEKQEDGSWKVAVDIFNTDNPMEHGGEE